MGTTRSIKKARMQRVMRKISHSELKKIFNWTHYLLETARRQAVMKKTRYIASCKEVSFDS